jgi:hypothetical protein
MQIARPLNDKTLIIMQTRSQLYYLFNIENSINFSKKTNKVGAVMNISAS